MTGGPTVAGAPAGLGWTDARRVHPGRRRRPDVVALDGLTLDCPAGELLVLLGPSGSGKSTALRALAGVERLDGGGVHIGGQDVTDVPAHRRDVAMVFQDLALFPHLTVAENILFGPSVRGEVAAAEASLAEVAEVLGLAEVLGRRPDQLSGGQRQRVALARAMVRRPAVFLLDEPLSNLDARLRVDARTEVVALQRRLGTTMVHVTHDQAEAMTMADRLAILRDGRLEQVGTPREVYDQPASVFVATFVGSPPMALLPAGTFGEPGGHDTVGVRAEDLTLQVGGGAEAAGTSAPAGAGLRGVVALQEDLGNEVLAIVDTAEGTVPVRLPARAGRAVGEPVEVVVTDPARLHRFDADGRRVAGP